MLDGPDSLFDLTKLGASVSALRPYLWRETLCCGWMSAAEILIQIPRTKKCKSFSKIRSGVNMDSAGTRSIIHWYKSFHSV